MASRIFTTTVFLAVVPILAFGGMLLAGVGNQEPDAAAAPPPQAPEPPALDEESSGSQDPEDTPVSDTRLADSPAELVTYEIFLTDPDEEATSSSSGSDGQTDTAELTVANLRAHTIAMRARSNATKARRVHAWVMGDNGR